MFILQALFLYGCTGKGDALSRPTLESRGAIVKSQKQP
ncbi:hypothetical protein RK21_01207 [Pseudomonas plecoglossicida]|nr:hypothetical protein RK21_01207 [Pseudomonas plecoglossicida]